MKRSKAIDFLTITLFFGILLTFMIYIGLDTLVEYEVDGISEPGESIGGFNKIFYNEENIDGFVNSFDYRVFGHTGNNGIIIGKDYWLFEAKDTQSGYERLLDYIGGSPFNEWQLERIHQRIDEDNEYFAENGVEYLLVVVPDSMTVCSDNVPQYLGGQSKNTRRGQLAAYLSGYSDSAFVDPTAPMIEASGQMSTYNNTENSINAYGAYIIYDTVIQRLGIGDEQGVRPILKDDVEFFTRLTDGKSIAVRAGLDKTVKNRTVSLTDKMGYYYKVVGSGKESTLTRMNEATNNVRIIVECGDDWDRTQLTPYLSNTFYEVVYTANAEGTRAALKEHGATAVIRIVHEGDLVNLAR